MQRNDRLLVESVEGNLIGFSELCAINDGIDFSSEIRSSRLVLRVGALVNVLRQMKSEEFDANTIQRWASFIRRGYIPNSSLGSTKPRLVEYDRDAEGIIIDIIGRLDEIGDSIDGKICKEELDMMISKLLNSGI